MIFRRFVADVAQNCPLLRIDACGLASHFPT
jgi:hypothetical protein